MRVFDEKLADIEWKIRHFQKLYELVQVFYDKIVNDSECLPFNCACTRETKDHKRMKESSWLIASFLRKIFLKAFIRVQVGHISDDLQGFTLDLPVEVRILSFTSLRNKND